MVDGCFSGTSLPMPVENLGLDLPMIGLKFCALLRIFANGTYFGSPSPRSDSITVTGTVQAPTVTSHGSHATHRSATGSGRAIDRAIPFFSTPRFSLDGVPFKEGGSQVTRTEHAKQIKGSPRQTVLRQKLVAEHVAELYLITRQIVPNPIFGASTIMENRAYMEMFKAPVKFNTAHPVS